ncbi:hypothetical protein DL770_008277 [Monosporascus sp. CRB-9-2]|nr:hypothetical protein DL770_008277 [Monosporascus sp. CRB-9-2]
MVTQRVEKYRDLLTGIKKYVDLASTTHKPLEFDDNEEVLGNPKTSAGHKPPLRLIPDNGYEKLLTMARAIGALILDKHDETVLIMDLWFECSQIIGGLEVNPIYLVKLAQGLRAGVMGSGGGEDVERLDTPGHNSQMASMIKEPYHDAACRQVNTPLPPPGIAAARTKPARGLLALVQASKRAEKFTTEGIDKKLETYREDVEAAKNDLENVAQFFCIKSERLKEETMDYLEVRD